MGPGEEGETPREGKAHEGCGSRNGLNHRPRVRTLAGSKALKWGLVPMGRVKHIAVRMKGHHLGGLEGQRDWRGTGSWTNRMRATAFERTCGSAGGKNPGG
jgi:hypothetical protein